jgi:hypothetical protein
MAQQSLPMFSQAAKATIVNSQLCHNLCEMTTTIRSKRAVIAFTIELVPVLFAL